MRANAEADAAAAKEEGEVGAGQRTSRKDGEERKARVVCDGETGWGGRRRGEEKERKRGARLAHAAANERISETQRPREGARTKSKGNEKRERQST